MTACTADYYNGPLGHCSLSIQPRSGNTMLDVPRYSIQYRFSRFNGCCADNTGAISWVEPSHNSTVDEKTN